ncbi:putative membrane protein [Campylobacter concisus]|uniref:Putative membrane protein n=1 Tax=Campylobacter concisus TaxID=199 RepID=A0A0M4SAC2_9BACT|nr:putative membrane protein [Campylobacter concisus]
MCVVSAYIKPPFCRLGVRKFILIFIFLLSQSLALGANFVINNDEILSQKVSVKLNEIGSELYAKSGINLVVGVYKDGELEALFKDQNLSSPYAFLLLIKGKKKVEIFADANTSKLFNKEQILSVNPESGTIIPILVSKNGKDVYNAAILNGYADIAEQIASSLNLQLESSVGNSNKTTLNFLRFFIYGLVAFFIIVIFYKKVKNG